MPSSLGDNAGPRCHVVLTHSNISGIVHYPFLNTMGLDGASPWAGEEQIIRGRRSKMWYWTSPASRRRRGNLGRKMYSVCAGGGYGAGTKMAVLEVGSCIDRNR